MSLKEKLLLVQSELKVPKNNRNSFGNYNYRSAEDIQEESKKVLVKYGLTLVLTDSIEFIGVRYYVKATASLFLGEESIVVTAFAREEEAKKGMDGSQITGAASSYARKYALNGLFLIDDTKDADATNDHGKNDAKPKVDMKPRADVVKPRAANDGSIKSKIEKLKMFTNEPALNEFYKSQDESTRKDIEFLKACSARKEEIKEKRLLDEDFKRTIKKEADMLDEEIRY